MQIWHVMLVFGIGASIGSFLNVCILRWPVNESVVWPRSRCPKCGMAVAWYDNIPVVSWLLLRAKCRTCAAPISAMYPAVEALSGVVWVVAWCYADSNFLALRVAVFCSILLGIAITDLRAYLIPDGFTVTGLGFLAATSIAGVFISRDVDGIAMASQFPFASPIDAFYGACVGAGAITIIGWLGEVVLKKEAMGFGDSTLMAMAGAALGPGRSLLTILIGAAIGAAAFVFIVIPVGKLRAARMRVSYETPLVPFGVFLAPAAAVALFWGDALLSWYLGRLLG